MKSKLCKLIDSPLGVSTSSKQKEVYNLILVKSSQQRIYFPPFSSIKVQKGIIYIICIYIIKGGEIVFQPTLTEAFYSQHRGSMSSEKPRGDYTYIIYIIQIYIYIIFQRVFLFTEVSYTLTVFIFKKESQFLFKNTNL